MKYHIQTFGCQMNVADSGMMGEHLACLGLENTASPDDADVIILNTCSVRQHAEHRALSFIGRLEPLKMKKPSLKIIVTGCTAQKERETLQKRFPIIDLVVGAKDIEHFPELFDQSIMVADEPANAKATRPDKNSISSFVTIMRGCDNFCSYCIVPFVRGREKSRTAASIISAVRQAAENGTKEIMLLGQNVNSYHDHDTDFPALLGMINGIAGIERIRFMTSHPKDLSDRLIDAMAELPKVCEHLHLPLQSGSDRVLSAMNRRYTAGHYLALIEKLRKRIPGISITTDVLIGFPGESDEDFRATTDLIAAVDFDFLFAFKYSSRPGTAAAALPDGIPEGMKAARHAEVLKRITGIAARRNAALVGSVQEVLVEGRKGYQCEGRTRTNKKVFLSSDNDLTGRLVRVKITGSRLNTLTGTEEQTAPPCGHRRDTA